MCTYLRVDGRAVHPTIYINADAASPASTRRVDGSAVDAAMVGHGIVPHDDGTANDRRVGGKPRGRRGRPYRTCLRIAGQLRYVSARHTHSTGP